MYNIHVHHEYASVCYFIVNNFSPDTTLTVGSVSTVVELVTADRMMKVWEELGVPESLVEMMSGNFSTPKEKTRACVDLYLTCHPYPSWSSIASALYYFGEMVAAKEAKPFYYQNGKHHCLC